MGRLPAGAKPELLSKRLQRYRQELELRGGRRVIVDLEPEAAIALSEVISGEGLEEARDKYKQAITKALVHYAKLTRRRAAG
jgi:hypothetical protein